MSDLCQCPQCRALRGEIPKSVAAQINSFTHQMNPSVVPISTAQLEARIAALEFATSRISDHLRAVDARLTALEKTAVRVVPV